MNRNLLMSRLTNCANRIRVRRWLSLMLMGFVVLQGLFVPAYVASAAAPFAPHRPLRIQMNTTERPKFVPGEVLVKYRPSAKRAAKQEIERMYQLTQGSHNWTLDIYRYQIPIDQDVRQVAAALANEPAVEFAEPNYYHYLHITPNDPLYSNLQFQGNTYPNSLQRWVYNGVGSNRNVNGEAAWDITTGRQDVVVAVIDSGVLLNHPDLAPNIWRNPNEIANNGVDDDRNGFVDDTVGWDFRGNLPLISRPDNDPNPDIGDGLDEDGNGAADDAATHGTFVAGIIAARGNDAAGIAGTTWSCRIMALKVFTDDGGASTQDIADAITYAASNGAAVINLSLGSEQPTQTQQMAVQFAHSRGAVIVASAGNDNSPQPNYPASYENVISVGASDYGGDFPLRIPPDINGRASFSQFGPQAVDVVAPGIVASTTFLTRADQLDGQGPAGEPTYDISGGTSFSGPLVAGLAALIISRARALNRSLTNDQVATIIQTTTVDLPDDPNDSPDAGPNWDGRGRVDMLAALNAVTGGPPGGGTQLTSGVPVTGTIPAPPPGGGVLGPTQYTIEVPAGATQLTVTLTGNQDVDLYVRFGQMITIQGGRAVADYRSESPTGNETITITPTTSPPLRSGTYFIAIANFGPGAASFTLTATITGGSTGGDTIALVSGVPVTGTIPAPPPGQGRLGDTQYTIQVPTGATQLTVRLNGNQDVDLFVRFGQRITIQNGQAVADYRADGVTGNETIVITPFSSPPLRAGTYFIAIANFGPGAASFTLQATITP